jgi:hypothetical protein
MGDGCSPSSATPSDREQHMVTLLVSAAVVVALVIVGAVGYMLDRIA